MHIHARIHKRITWLDAMKGLMILLVVFCHSLVLNKNIGVQGHIDTTLMYIIDTFIMPCFFAISGFLCKRVKTFKQYGILWYKKGIGLMIPYFIFSIILYFFLSIKAPLISIIYQPISLMWFLFALFFIFIIVGTLDLIRIPIWCQTIIYFVCMIVQTNLVWWDGANYNMNPVACIGGYIAFFYLGFLIKTYFRYLKKVLSKKYLIPILFIILEISIFIQAKYTGIFPYNTDGVALSDIVSKVISVFTFFNLFIAFKNIKINWLDTLGQNTLTVYLIHYFPLHAVYVFMMTNSITAPILVPLVSVQSVIRLTSGIIGSLIAVWLVGHVKVLKFFVYPRTYLDKLFKFNKSKFLNY